MPVYRIRVVNKDFRASNDVEHPDHKMALKAALKGAFQIGTDEVCGGKPFFGAEITIALDGDVLERRMVAIGATPLQ